MPEQWLPVNGYEGLYQVSSFGRIKSARNGRVMSPVLDTYGYETLKLYRAGKATRYKVHRLVCRAFNGDGPPDYDVAHLDGSRTNNTPSNLKWLSRKDNLAHKVEHGTAQRGERGAAAKLTAAQVEMIRQRGARGEKPIAIARDYPVGRSHIASIIRQDRSLWQ